ncbi:MAG: hypothetical protein K940chlam5_00649 [Candidatus Anoxychlamydiales bacterium]|nr:hypothetical protein [Candidatus Anoxychlamydiales bacterium]
MATKVLRSGSRHEVEPGRPERFQEIESDLTDIANQVRTILPTIKTKDGSNLADTIEKIERVKKRLNEIEGAMLQRENDYLRLEVELEQCKNQHDIRKVISVAIIEELREERGSMQEKIFSLEMSISERLDQIGAHLTELIKTREDNEHKITKLMVTGSLDQLFSTLSPRELLRLQTKNKSLDEEK